MKKWLYRYETKGIQSWILDSNLMRDLAGGSALVESLTDEAEKQAKIAGASEIVQATSGSMTAVFPDQNSLQKFASTWPMVVECRAPGLHLVQAWTLESESLGKLFRKLGHRRNRVHVSGFEAGPWVLRSGRSGLPAVPTPPDIRSKARMTALDEAAVAKERARNMQEAVGAVTGGRPWGDFEQEVDDWIEGPVGVIHADGSGVGQRLINLENDYEKLRAFSEALKEATRDATARALETLPATRKLQARPIVSAGDDLTYIVPGARARAFATRWLLALEDETKKRESELGGGLWGGAGIAYVHRRFPFSRAYEMAESLCKDAKEAVRGRQQSVIAFRRQTASLADNDSPGGIAWVIEAGEPGSPLDRLVEVLRELPRGPLRTWLTLFERGDDVRARQLWQRTQEVADTKVWDRFRSALTDVGADPNTGRLDTATTGRAVALGGVTTPIRDGLALRHIEKEVQSWPAAD